MENITSKNSNGLKILWIYPKILHKGAATYIRILNIFAYLSPENRAANKCLAPISFLLNITLNQCFSSSVYNDFIE